MSIAATAWAWGVDVSPSAKLVLLALADRADAEGECFPSVADIVRRTNLGERTVQRELKALESAGLLQRRIRALQSSYFVLSIGKDCNRGASVTGGVTVAGGASVAPRGATVAPIIITEPLEETLPYVGALSAADASPPAPPPRERAGHRLPADWQPDEPTYAGVNTDTTLPRFRDYWTAQPGAKGRKADWQATWRNWCRREAERPKPKLHTLPPAEQDRRILTAAGLTFADPPTPAPSLPLRLAQ